MSKSSFVSNIEHVMKEFSNHVNLHDIRALKCFHRNLTGFQLQKKSLKVSKDFSGSRRALFGKTISVNDLYYFASVNELG